ncbi:MAG: ABC transporter ATP-binding protein [Azospirillum sp.]|nr:ABC transporter ATP-binding protein [Azospirillum sp.]
MTEDAVVVSAVTKRFKLYDSLATGPLKEMLFFWRREDFYKEFVAVNDVSFRIRRGEVVGIVGANGAGKTTLLKLIAGLLPMEGGEIQVRGKVTALLALGVGVHPEFTGRENIYYSGLLLGMAKEEVQRKTPAIVEFAEIGDFIDRPFRSYSSGMRARLLFAISMSIDPDILIVDEALATGDAHFVRKCAKRIRELCSSGATILFVSHNLTQIETLCTRALLLERGRLIMDGAPAEVTREYNERVRAAEVAGVRANAGALSLLRGSGQVEITASRLRDTGGAEVASAYTGDAVTLELDYTSRLPPDSPCTLFVGIVRQGTGEWVGEMSTNAFIGLDGAERREDLRLAAAGTLRVHLKPLLLLNDHYSFWIMIYNGTNVHCEYRGVAPLFAARRTHSLDRGPVYSQPFSLENQAF